MSVIVETAKIPSPDNKAVEVQLCQLELNEQDQVALIGANFDDYPDGYNSIREPKYGVEDDCMGKLEDQNFIFKQQLINSLTIGGWDFKKCPNPEVLLLRRIPNEFPFKLHDQN